MFGQAIFLHIGAQVLCAPMGQRINLDQARGRVRFEHVERAARPALVAFAPGDQRAKIGHRLQRRLQGRAFAQGTAGIGVFAVQPAAWITVLQCGARGVDDAQIAQVQTLCQFLLIDQRFDKMLPRLKEENRQVRLAHCDKVQEHRRLCAKAGNERDLPQLGCLETDAQGLLGAA